MCFNNGNNDCSCLWIILIIILWVCCCGGSWGGNWGGCNCGNIWNDICGSSCW